MKFLQNKIEIKTLAIKNFFNNVINFIFGEIVIHNSHVSSDIIGYAHDFYYRKLKENQKLIPVFAHYLLSFKLYVWRTKCLQ